MAHVVREASAANRTIVAVQYHTARVRQKTSEVPPDPSDILGAAVESHHKSKSLLCTPLRAESRGSSLLFREIDDFDCAEDEGDGTSDAVVPLQPETPDQPVRLPSVDSVTVPKAAPSAKKALQDEDPTALLRRMRSHTAARSMALRAADSLAARGPSTSMMKIPLDEDDGSIFKEVTSMRTKSFLLRPESQSGSSPADDMLAQIRGSNWAVEGGGKALQSCKSTPLKPVESSAQSICLTSSASSLRPSVSGSVSGSKSFTAGKRSGALPGISIDGRPVSGELARSPVSTARQSGHASPMGGLFSKLRQMVKH